MKTTKEMLAGLADFEVAHQRSRAVDHEGFGVRTSSTERVMKLPNGRALVCMGAEFELVRVADMQALECFDGARFPAGGSRGAARSSVAREAYVMAERMAEHFMNPAWCDHELLPLTVNHATTMRLFLALGE